MLGIGKRGDTYPGNLLILGAFSVLNNAKALPPWSSSLAERRPMNVNTAAPANKMARTIWALPALDRTYQPNFAYQPT